MKIKMLILILAIFIIYCNKEKEIKSFIDSNRSNIIDDAKNYIINIASSPLTPVDYNLLIKFIPRDFEGADAEDVDAKTVSILNMKSTYAKAIYNFPDKSYIKINIVDIAGNKNHPVFISFTTLTMTGVEEEGINGYKKIIKIGEFHGYRQFRKSNKKTDLSLLVGYRIILKLLCVGIEEDDVDKFIKKIKLKKLSKIN
jgi:hypothetical protein